MFLALSYCSVLALTTRFQQISAVVQHSVFTAFPQKNAISLVCLLNSLKVLVYCDLYNQRSNDEEWMI